MRIAYMAGTVLPSRAAAAVNVLKMCRSFAAAGHDVTLYARGRQTDAPAVFAELGLERRFDLVLRDPPAAEPGPCPPPSLWPGRRGAPQLGHVGHFFSGKGMEVAAALAALLPECDVHAVGGTERDLALWRGRCAGQANLHLHGFVAHGSVHAWLVRFDLLLAPPAPRVSSAAGREIGRWMSPLKVFEYMAAGKPILASDIPALREILRDGDTALLLPPGEPQAWADAARALLREPGRAAALAARARTALLAEYTWDVRAARILAHLPQRGGAAA